MKLTSDSIEKLSQSKQRFLILLCLILGLLVLVPILNRFVAAHIFLDIFLTAIVISMVYTISHKKGHVIAGVFLAVVMLASMWLQYAYPNKGILAIGMIAGVIFIAVVIVNILRFMFKSEEINREIIYAAILLYLLTALMWAFVYTFLELIDPASFNIDLSQPEGYLLVFQYYSFVTITTLGYGDITPVTEVAKAFSVLEAVFGQLYLVVVVAWLVGMHVSKKSKQ
jgi:voltage-gated potassium channel